MKQPSEIFGSKPPGEDELLLAMRHGSSSALNDPFANESLQGLTEYDIQFSELEFLKESIVEHIEKNQGSNFINGFLIAIILPIAWLLILAFYPFAEPATHSGEAVLNYENTSEAYDVFIKETLTVPVVVERDTNGMAERLNKTNDSKEVEPIEKQSFDFTNAEKTLTDEKKSEMIELDLQPAPKIGIEKLSSETQLGGINHSSFKVLYINGYLMADFRQYYEGKIKVRNRDIPTGTVVNSSELRLEPGEAIGPYRFFSYESLMDSAMKLFDRSEYKNTLKIFDELSDIYPGDVNVVFYRGLCYYHMAVYDRALDYFKAATVYPVLLFYEESVWYQALTYQKMGDTEQSEKLLRLIIAKKGFYAKQAVNRIQQLEKR
jgi:tetratricopeptide (TPR) repeat protein